MDVLWYKVYFLSNLFHYLIHKEASKFKDNHFPLFGCLLSWKLTVSHEAQASFLGSSWHGRERACPRNVSLYSGSVAWAKHIWLQCSQLQHDGGNILLLKITTFECYWGVRYLTGGNWKNNLFAPSPSPTSFTKDACSRPISFYCRSAFLCHEHRGAVGSRQRLSMVLNWVESAGFPAGRAQLAKAAKD